jgi:phosphoribosylamine--glycine ligase
MRILVIGGGGREHALAWKCAQSERVREVFVAPGNAGTALEPKLVNVAIAADDTAALVGFAQREAIDLTIVGPEGPLVAGVVDRFAAAGLACFGPRQSAARLEGSKAYAKDFLLRHGIPTASYRTFTREDFDPAYLTAQRLPVVIKADGLAAGKGVTVAMSLAEAEAAVESLFDGAFGAAGAEAVIEAFLEGEEASFFALCDGDKALAFASAQDHKRVGDGDQGPNTGGMGAYSPAPVMTPEISARVMAEIIEPTVAAMKAEGCPFKGVLFAGLMIGKNGPQLIEFNTRFGDPECQVMLARLEDDLLGLLLACAEGRLPDAVHLSPQTALTVVLAAQGYPAAPKKGGVIEGIEKAEAIEGVSVTHAGTRLAEGKLLANGGRVLNVTALAGDVAAAQALAYQGVDAITFPEGFWRRDIGWRAVGR